MALIINRKLALADHEITLTAVRAQGAGGQNVNKVASAIHLRFDIGKSSLPEYYKERLLALRDQRVTAEGIIIIKAQQHRTQEKNRADALERLAKLIRRAGLTRKPRRPTAPSRQAIENRIAKKAQRGRLKTMRKKIAGEE